MFLDLSRPDNRENADAFNPHSDQLKWKLIDAASDSSAGFRFRFCMRGCWFEIESNLSSPCIVTGSTDELESDPSKF